jgi:ribonuclease BN (tRNA processing enzyme)
LIARPVSCVRYLVRESPIDHADRHPTNSADEHRDPRRRPRARPQGTAASCSLAASDRLSILFRNGDTDEGAVVFSGDTAPSQNLVRLAKGADILVHEVIVSAWIDRILPPPRNPAQEALRTHLLSAHTPVEMVGKVAESAGVSTLVLNHIVPGNARAEELTPAQQDFAGQLIIGEDLLQLGVRRARH